MNLQTSSSGAYRGQASVKRQVVNTLANAIALGHLGPAGGRYTKPDGGTEIDDCDECMLEHITGKPWYHTRGNGDAVLDEAEKKLGFTPAFATLLYQRYDDLLHNDTKRHAFALTVLQELEPGMDVDAIVAEVGNKRSKLLGTVRRHAQAFRLARQAAAEARRRHANDNRKVAAGSVDKPSRRTFFQNLWSGDVSYKNAA